MIEMVRKKTISPTGYDGLFNPQTRKQSAAFNFIREGVTAGGLALTDDLLTGGRMEDKEHTHSCGAAT